MLLPLPVQNNIAGIASHRAWHRVTKKTEQIYYEKNYRQKTNIKGHRYEIEIYFIKS